MKIKSKEDFKLYHISRTLGRIEAWKHIKALCNSCIKAHKKELKTERIEELIEMNASHLIFKKKRQKGE